MERETCKGTCVNIKEGRPAMTQRHPQKGNVRQEIALLVLGGAVFICGAVCFSVMCAKLLNLI